MQLRRSILIALMLILFIYFEIHSCSDKNPVTPVNPVVIESLLCYANDIFFLDRDHGWVVGQQGTLLLTVNGGENWEAVRVGNRDIRSITFLDSQHGWLICRGGYLYRSFDGGRTWEASLFPAHPLEDDFFKIEFSDMDHGFVLGYPGVYVTTDGGGLWENNWLPVVPARGAWNMSIVDRVTGFLLGSKWTDSDPELLYRTDDGGMNWKAVDGSNASVLRAVLTVDFSSPMTGWAGGGVIMKTTDGGANWFMQRETATVREFSFLDESTGYAAGSNTIMKTVDGGTNWADVTPEDDRIVDLRGVFFLDPATGWVTGRGRDETIGDRIYKYSIIMSTTNGGADWSLIEFAYDVTDLDLLTQTEDQP